MTTNSPARPWWLDPLPEAAAKTDAATSGLSGAEAKTRLAKFGPNLFQDHQENPLWRQFLARFKNPLIILLLIVLPSLVPQLNIIQRFVLPPVEWATGQYLALARAVAGL